MTENKIELKPCPFCGEGKIIKIEQSHRNGFTIKYGMIALILFIATLVIPRLNNTPLKE
jgi:hypothetical protein